MGHLMFVHACAFLQISPYKKKVCALKAKNAPYHLSMILSSFCPCETLQICQMLMLPAWFWALLGFLKENMHCLKWCSLLWTPPWPTCSPLSCLLPTGLPAFGRARWAQRGSCAELCRAVLCQPAAIQWRCFTTYLGQSARYCLGLVLHPPVELAFLK